MVERHVTYGWRGRLGLVTINDNLVMEAEFSRYLPSGVSLAVTRIVDKVDFDALAEDARARVAELADARVDVIVFGCTSGTFFKGREWELEFKAELQRIARRPVVTTAESLLQALHQLDVKRIAVATPYTAEIEDALARYLKAAGFEIVCFPTGLGLDFARDINRLSAREVRDLVVAARDANAEAYLVSCTAIEILDHIDSLEQDLGRPVVTSTQAVLAGALLALGVKENLPAGGRLLKRLAGSRGPDAIQEQDQRNSVRTRGAGVAAD